jgi:hypothetical protein
MNLLKIGSILGFVLLAGCASNPDYKAPGKTSDSAFFTDSSLLKPVLGHAGTLRYVDPNLSADSMRVHTIYLAPIEVWLDPASPYKGLTEPDITALTQEFRKAFLADPDRRYQLVDTPTADTLVVRVALTGVQLSKARTKLLSFTPVGLVVKGIKAASGISPITVDRIGVLAEGTLGPTGKSVFAVQAAPRVSLSEQDGTESSPDRLDQIPDKLAIMAKRLRAALNSAMH